MNSDAKYCLQENAIDQNLGKWEKIFMLGKHIWEQEKPIQSKFVFVHKHYEWRT